MNARTPRLVAAARMAVRATSLNAPVTLSAGGTRFPRMSAATTPTVLHLSLVVGGGLRDRGGERIGKVDDLLVRLGEDYPPVTGVLATVAGRPVFVAASEVAEIAHGRVDLL